MRSVSLVTVPLILAALATGCVRSNAQARVSSAMPDNKIDVIVLGNGSFAYFIDANTETCALGLLSSHGAALVPVDCAKLARTVPPAAAVMPWMSKQAVPPMATPPAPPAAVPPPQ